MRKQFLLYVFVIVFNFCFSQDIPKIRISPKQVYGGFVSEYFSDVEYIPLETTKESLFGDIHQFIKTDSSMVILDNDTRSVLFFSLKGFFLKKIKTKEGFHPIVLYNNSKNKTIIIGFINSVETAKVIEFTSTGEYVREMSFSQKLFRDLNLVNFEDNIKLEFNSFKKDGLKQNDSIVHFINVFKNDSLYKQLLPYRLHDKMGFFKIGGQLITDNLQKTNANVYYAATNYENIIYKISQDTVTAVFQIIFPRENAVDPIFLSSKKEQFIDSMVTNNLYKGKDLVYSISDIHFFNKKMFFRTQSTGYAGYYSPDGMAQRNFIYDFNLNKTFSLERITPDKYSYYLPIINQEKTTNHGVSLLDNIIYTSLPSLQLFAAYEKNKSKKPQYPPVLQQYFKTQNRKSNPVIVRMKLKD